MKQIQEKLTSLFKSKREYLIVPGIVILAIVLYMLKGFFIAASVNGHPISRLTVISELEKEGGKSVLDRLVTQELVYQEARKQNITVNNSEISDQINQITANLKAQNQDLDTALSMQGMTRSDLNNQIKLQILIKKLAAKDITVSDSDAKDYFDKNQSTFPKGTKFDSVKDQIKKDLTNQKTNEAITTWLDNLKTKAKINYFVSY